MISVKEAANTFSAIGSESRLLILKTLINVHPEYITVGEIKDKLNIPSSTLNYHLNALLKSELIIQEKKGREILCQANCPTIEELIRYLTREYKTN